MEIRPIAHIRSDFGGKFGIPRQSGVVPELVSYVVFEPEFRSDDALRGIDGFDYLWLIWEFSANRHESWSPTVRPPRLGGNVRRVYSPRARPTAPIRSDCPASGSTRCCARMKAPSCACWARICWTAHPSTTSSRI